MKKTDVNRKWKMCHRDRSFSATSTFTTSLLHIAIEYGHVSIIEYLLKAGADVDKKNSLGEVPLDVAVRQVSYPSVLHLHAFHHNHHHHHHQSS